MIVLGSGFAGSLVALILQKIGRSVVVVDKATHPRFAIGESSTPIGNMILRDLAERYALDALKPLATYGTWLEHQPDVVRGRKRGFSYFQHQQGSPFQTDANHTQELLVTASTDNYRCDTHWLRADVDHYFIRQAKQAGVTVLEQTRIQAIKQQHQHLTDGAWQLEAMQNETRIHIEGTFVVDATGPAGLLPHALGIGRLDETLQTRSHAIFSHFEGIPAWHETLQADGIPTDDHPYFCDDAAVHHCIDNGWLWMLRFDNQRVSAGFALDAAHFRLNYSVSPETAWQTLLEQYPSIQALFSQATLADLPGKLYRTGRLQRLWQQAAGANWALLPHTTGFIDPLHSTGIAHTLSGVERLAHLLEQHWQQPALQSSLMYYSDAIINELKLVDLLVAGCYPCFGKFDLLCSYSMLYFAAAITYEERRMAAHKAGTPFKHGFLCADEAPLVTLIHEGYTMLRTTLNGQRTHQQFRDAMEKHIAPYNTAGLFHPRINNMYEYTAADL